MKHAIIYCRFSPRPNAVECRSNEKQEERCRTYCASKGYTPVAVYHDSAVSGKLMERPGLKAALAAVCEGRVLVVDTSDRLARDMLVSLTIRHQVNRLGATIEVADGSPQTDTPEGELFANILAAFAAYERSRFARRTKAGLAKKKARGEHLGRIPIGWKVDPASKQLVHDENEQKAIAKAVALKKLSYRAEGVEGTVGVRLSSEKIAQEITDEFGPVRGRPWSARTIRRVLMMHDESGVA